MDSSVLILTLLCNFIMSMIASRAGTLALVGSDFCHISPDIQLIKLLNKVSHKTDICNSTSGYKFLCLVQNCSDGQEMLRLEKLTRNEAYEYFTDKVYPLGVTINNQYIGDQQYGNLCQRYINDTINNFYLIDEVFVLSDEVFICDNVNSLYKDYLYTTFCNGIVVHYGVVWITLVAAISGSMIMITFALLIDLDLNNYNSLI
jgi:hypothetical protein